MARGAVNARCESSSLFARNGNCTAAARAGRRLSLRGRLHVQAHLVSPSDLSVRDQEHWRALQRAVPEFRSPLMGPDFAMIVGRVRRDAAVLVFTRDGRPVGFLPHHRRPFGMGRPIGAPFSDLHGLVSENDLGLDAEAVVRHAGLKSFQFSGLIDPFAVFAGSATEHRPSYCVEGTEAFQQIRCTRKPHFKRAMRGVRDLAAGGGDVQVHAPDHRSTALECTFRWKRDQLRRTGLHDFFRPEWTRVLMKSIFDSPFGMLVTLNLDGKPIAGRFGFAAGGVCHAWITAHDPSLARHTPGNILLWKLLEAMPALGLDAYDMGPGNDHHKRLYSTGTLSVGVGSAPARARSMLRTPASMRRRLDQIAEIELDEFGRAYGLFTALATHVRRPRRGAGAGAAD